MRLRSIFILLLIPVLLTGWSWGKKDDQNQKPKEENTQTVDPNQSVAQIEKQVKPVAGGYSPAQNPAQAIQGWKDVYRVKTVSQPVMPPRIKYTVANIPIKSGKIAK